MALKFIAAALAAAATLALAPASTATAAEPPVVAVIGDSFTAGWTTTTRNQADAWWQYTARDLGWQVGNIIANPGGGFVNRGDYGTLAQALRDHPIASWTDYVLVQGGLTDSFQDPNRVPAAVADLLAVIRQQAPAAVPIVIGSFAPIPDHSYGPHHVEVARRIGDWQAIGDTRYLTGFTCTFDVSADQVHPTAAGHQQIGDWIAWHLAHGLNAGQPLQWNGSSYTA